MKTSMTHQELKPTIARLREMQPGVYGTVEVADERITVAIAEYENGWAEGEEEHVIRSFKVNGKFVSIIDAAKAMASEESVDRISEAQDRAAKLLDQAEEHEAMGEKYNEYYFNTQDQYFSDRADDHFELADRLRHKAMMIHVNLNGELK